MNLETLDLLPYGIIILDSEGTVIYYSPREEQISGRVRENVVGRNFFTDIAPCTAVREFMGRYSELMESGGRSVEFDFLFNFPAPQRNLWVNKGGGTSRSGHRARG